MQKKHQYQLSMRDYTDVASWIQRYGTHKSNEEIVSLKGIGSG